MEEGLALTGELWTRHWHLLCHRSELSASRAFARFDILGAEVVAFNDGGSVVVFDNRCPHRGARIFVEDHGARRFVCPYHGWSFANGRVFVGNKEAFAHCDLSGLDLRRLRIEWLGDFLFVSWDPAASLLDQLGGVADIVERISYSIDRRTDYNAYAYECDWRIGLENALEPYHVSMIHPESLGTLDLQRGRNEYFGRNSIWFSEVGAERTSRRLKSLGRMFDLGYQFEGYMSIYMFPFTMISSTFGYSYSLQNFFPSATAERTHFYSRLLTSRLREGVKPELLESFFESSAALNRQTFDEDHVICKRVPLDSWSEATPRVWSQDEEKLVHFRQSYAAFRAERAGS